MYVEQGHVEKEGHLKQKRQGTEKHMGKRTLGTKTNKKHQRLTNKKDMLEHEGPSVQEGHVEQEGHMGYERPRIQKEHVEQKKLTV